MPHRAKFRNHDFQFLTIFFFKLQQYLMLLFLKSINSDN